MPVNKKRPPVPEPPPLETFDEDGFTLVTATFRGTKYVVKEMTAAEYEKAVQASRDADGKSDDMVLMRLMFAKCIKEPEGLSVEQIMARPASVIASLNSIMQNIHFRWVESDEEKAYREAEEARAKAEEDEEEGEAKAA